MTRMIPEPRRDGARVRMGQGVDQATAVDALRNSVRDDDFEAYTDIVVDISAMPPDVYFPALKGILGRAAGAASAGGPRPRGGETGPAPPVYAAASENAELDAAIVPVVAALSGECYGE